MSDKSFDFRIEKRAWIPISHEAIADALAIGESLQTAMDLSVDRWLHPWKFADRAPMPNFNLFPRSRRVRHAGIEAVRRVREAAKVLRYGHTTEDDEW